MHLIASTGRSGSGYISQVLTKSGLPCGHERYFVEEIWGHKEDHWAIDSAWPGVKIMDQADLVFHQVRDPLRVLSSLLGWFARPDIIGEAHSTRVWNYRLSIAEMAGLTIKNDFYLDGMAMIYGMNKLIEEKAVMRWRLEDIDFNTIHVIITRCGVEANPEAIINALNVIPHNFNKHPDGPQLTWDKLPDCEVKHLLRAQAESYGYQY